MAREVDRLNSSPYSTARVNFRADLVAVVRVNHVRQSRRLERMNGSKPSRPLRDAP
jgi:hypothetical protein